MKTIGLRIDVDTLRGAREGVPRLCASLAARSIRGTFFFSVGPDNMGRHIWRLFRPAFLLKMLRSNAAGLYGWDILLRGVFWPGPKIGAHAKAAIRGAAMQGHETGFHAWDHHAWQAGVERWSVEKTRAWFEKGVAALSDCAGTVPRCSAAPAWKCGHDALRVKEEFGFAFNSDCRGASIFRPIIEGCPMPAPQVPVTLPTYDETIGRGGVTRANYNERLLALLRPEALNVLTIHAEAEGIACADLWEEFLNMATAAGWSFAALGDILNNEKNIPFDAFGRADIAGRDGWIAAQGNA